MKRKSRYLTLWSVTAAAVITAMALTAATYAWFTSNREVSTSKATSRTGNGNVELQIGREGVPLQKDEDGTYFTPMKGSKEYYKQLGSDKEDEFVLMPVSTAKWNRAVFPCRTASRDSACASARLKMAGRISCATAVGKAAGGV